MANKNIKGITIEIGGDTTKLGKALEDINKKAKDTQSELKDVQNLLKLDPKNTELLAQKQELLKQKIGETREKLDILKNAESQVQEQFQKGEVSEEQYRALKQEIEATEISLKRLQEEAEKSNNTLEKVGEAVGKVGTVSENLGKKFMPATTAIIGAGTAAGVMASNLEDAMAKVSTIADTAEVPLDELQTQIMNLSDETGVAATDIAENVYNAISAGQKTGDAVNFVSNATKLAKAGFAETGDALDILTTILNSYGLEAGEVGNVSNKLITTQNLGKTTVAELSAAMGKAIPTAKSVGINLDELCGSYAVMTSNGIATAETTTYLNSMLNELGKQGTSAANAFAKGTEHIKEGGLSMKEAMEMGWSLTDVLSILDEEAYASGTTINNLFGSAEAGKAASVLWDNAEGLNTAVEQMGESAGATDEAYKKLGTTSSKVKKTINQLKNTATELGGTLLDTVQPVITKCTEKVKDFTEWVKSLNDTQKKAIIIIAGIVAAIGPALIGFGKLSSGVSKVIGVVANLKGALGAGGGLAKVLTALSGPVGIAIAVIAALAAGFIALYKHNDKFKEKVDSTMAKVKDSFSGMWENAKPIIGQLKDTFSNLLTALEPVFEFILTYIGSIVNGIIEAAPSIIAAVQNVIEFITDIINAFTCLINGDFDGFFAYIEQALINVIGIVKNLLMAGINFIIGFLNGFGVDVKQIFFSIWNSICTIFKGTAQWFGTQFKNAWMNIQNAFANVPDFFFGLWEKIKGCFIDIGVKIGTAVGDAFKNAINSVLATIEGIVNNFIGMINGVIDIINEIPGVSLGKIDTLALPRLAKGGVLKEGTAMVAEAGPELLSMVNGKAVVTPLTGSARNTSMEDSLCSRGEYRQTINITSPKALSPYEVGRQTRLQTRRMILAIQRG